MSYLNFDQVWANYVVFLLCLQSRSALSSRPNVIRCWKRFHDWCTDTVSCRLWFASSILPREHAFTGKSPRLSRNKVEPIHYYCCYEIWSIFWIYFWTWDSLFHAYNWLRYDHSLGVRVYKLYVWEKFYLWYQLTLNFRMRSTITEFCSPFLRLRFFLKRVIGAT